MLKYINVIEFIFLNINVFYQNYNYLENYTATYLRILNYHM